MQITWAISKPQQRSRWPDHGASGAKCFRRRGSAGRTTGPAATHVAAGRTRLQLVLRLVAILFCGVPAVCAQVSDYVSAGVCAGCHPAHASSQARSAHARALSAPLEHPLATAFTPGRDLLRPPRYRFQFGIAGGQFNMAISDGAASRSMPVDWAFGAGSQAITFVSRLSTEHYLEHYFSYYPAIRGFGPTPGQTGLRSNTLDLASGYMYRAGDAVSGIIKCFECHSTGPVQSDSDNRLAPSQLGVRCEACHGPGRRHVLAASAGRQSKALISNPGRLSAGQLNQMCGTCHRATEDGLMANPDKAWSVRYQPIYFAKSQCFLRARGALSCLTCHDSHQPLERASLDYDKKCTGCHGSTSHRAKTEKPVGSCVECHMPRVPAQANLAFTNHWIGVYDKENPVRPRR